MTILYKHFLKVRIVLCAALLIFCAAFNVMPSRAADPVFTIEGVAVDVTAENAIAAREQAFEQAQIKAFEELAARMLPENEIATTPIPEPMTISTMIQDFEITSEQLSAVRYLGTYTFRFKDQAVRQYFSRSGMTFSDVSSKSMLVLPFLRTEGQTTLWSPFNDWRQAWNRAGNPGALGGIVPLELPLGDLTDVRDIRDNEALSYNPTSMQNLVERYDSAEAVITIASPDPDLAAITNDDDIAQGTLGIEIYRTDRAAPELTQQLNIPANGVQTKGQLYDSAVIAVHKALQQDWKARTSVRSVQNSAIEVSIPIGSLEEWITIQSDLKRIPGINDVVLRALSPRQAVVDLFYQGDESRLALTLGQAGLMLQQGMSSTGQRINVLTNRTGPLPPDAAPSNIAPNMAPDNIIPESGEPPRPQTPQYTPSWRPSSASQTEQAPQGQPETYQQEF